MSNFIGPSLPPNLLKADSCDEESDQTENDKQISLDSQDDVEIGPSLPPHMLRAASEDTTSCDWEKGPPQVTKHQNIHSQESKNSVDSIIGPVMPNQDRSTRMKKQSDNPTIGDTELKLGLSLPPKLRTKLKSKMSKHSGSSDDELSVAGPVLPPHLKTSSDEEDSQDVCVIGPSLPPFLRYKSEKRLSRSVDENSSITLIGPSLPPHLNSEREDELPTVVEDVVEEKPKSVLGPSLPPHFKMESKAAESDNGSGEEVYGPALPPGFHPKTFPVQKTVQKEQGTDSEDEDMGPLPEGNMLGSRVQHQLELRARQLREVMAAGEGSTKDMPTQRESWMLELPEDRAPELGLRPRQFRMREGPEAGDRSIWTDTPADRERKKKIPELKTQDSGALEKRAMLERDKVMQQLAEQHGSKRGNRSLVDLHEEKQQAKRKKAEEEGVVQERRPFSRDVDLQVNRFDEAQKRSILKKAQHLNDRFSSGHSKFL